MRRLFSLYTCIWLAAVGAACNAHADNDAATIDATVANTVADTAAAAVADTDAAAVTDTDAAAVTDTTADSASYSADNCAPLSGFQIEMEVRYMGLRADATIDLRRAANPDEYSYEVITRARGLARLVRSGTATETTTFRYAGCKFKPYSYKLDDGVDKAENDSDIRFDWANGIAYSSYRDESDEVELTPGLLDRLTTDMAVIVLLREGGQPGLYDIVDRNSIRRYEYVPQGEETLKVPAGTFHTVKYIRQRYPESSRSTLIWFATDADYLPVKIAQLKRGKSVVEMVAVKLVDGAAAAAE